MINTTTLFRLRRENRLEEAWQILLADWDPASIEREQWKLRACGHVLCDLCRQAATTGDKRFAEYASRFTALTFPESENYLVSWQQRFARQLADPRLANLEKAAREKNWRTVNRLGNTLLRAGNRDQAFLQILGWAWYRQAKEILDRSSARPGSVATRGECAAAKRFLEQYVRYVPPVSGLLHSCMLRIAVRIHKDQAILLKMLPFLRRWNPALFSDGDRTKYSGEDGKEYPSLEERAFTAAAGELRYYAEAARISPGEARLIEWFLPLLDTFGRTHPELIWIPWWAAHGMLAIGLVPEALKTALPFIRIKAAECWAWDFLASILHRLNRKEEALACLCRAVSCPTEETYKNTARMHLVSALADCGHIRAAKSALDAFLQAKKERAEQIRQELRDLLASDWYTAAISGEEKESLAQLCSRYARQADALLTDGLAWMEACVCNCYTKTMPDGRDKKRCRLAIRTDTGIQQASVNPAGLPDTTTGTPLRVKGTFDGEGHFRLVLAERRKEGVPWDILPSKRGVVVSVNQEKGLAWVVYDKEDEGPADLHPYDFIRPGDVIKAYILEGIHHGEKKTRCYGWKRTNAPVSPSIMKTFSGYLRLHERGFGFVDTDKGAIFIDPDLAEPLNDMEKVRGIAVLMWDRKKRQPGWRAVRLSPMK